MNLTLDSQPVPLLMDQDGVLRVANTRVTLETLINVFSAGATPEQIVQDFPVLQLVDVYAVITYYLQHHDEVIGYLHKQEKQAEQMRSQIESRFNPQGIRHRLINRPHPREELDASTADG